MRSCVMRQVRASTMATKLATVGLAMWMVIGMTLAPNFCHAQEDEKDLKALKAANEQKTLGQSVTGRTTTASERDVPGKPSGGKRQITPVGDAEGKIMDRIGAVIAANRKKYKGQYKQFLSATVQELRTVPGVRTVREIPNGSIGIIMETGRAATVLHAPSAYHPSRQQLLKHIQKQEDAAREALKSGEARQ